MTKHHQVIEYLTSVGITHDDAVALRRISMTLRNWFEQECGVSNDFCSYSIVRGHMNNGTFVYDDNGKPYRERVGHREGRHHYSPMPDLERGAMKRLGKIMAQYPGLSPYIQTDPRGASLYIMRPNDVPEGSKVDSCYNCGIAVYK